MNLNDPENIDQLYRTYLNARHEAMTLTSPRIYEGNIIETKLAFIVGCERQTPMLTRGQLANEVKRLMSMDAVGEDACDLVWFREFWRRRTSDTSLNVGDTLTGLRFEFKSYSTPEE